MHMRRVNAHPALVKVVGWLLCTTDSVGSARQAVQGEADKGEHEPTIDADTCARLTPCLKSRRASARRGTGRRRRRY